MSKFCVLRAKTYSFLINGFTDEDYVKNGIVTKKAKGTKKCVVKLTITFNMYVQALFNDKKILRSQCTFRSDHHKVYTQKINKIALSNNDGKRIKAHDKITSYPYGYFDNDDKIVHIKNINTKSELDILREEAKTLRNNSLSLRKEAYTILNNSKVFTKEINDIIKESHAIKNSKRELDFLKEEAKTLRNNSLSLRKEAYTIRNNSKVLRKEINYIIEESHAIKDNKKTM